MESNKEEKIKTVSEENIYKLNGRVPLTACTGDVRIESGSGTDRV